MIRIDFVGDNPIASKIGSAADIRGNPKLYLFSLVTLGRSRAAGEGEGSPFPLIGRSFSLMDVLELDRKRPKRDSFIGETARAPAFGPSKLEDLWRT